MVISSACQQTAGNTNPESSLELALAAAKTAIDNRGQEVLVLDTRQQTSLFDYFVIATGTSRRQLHAMSEEIDHKLEDELHDRRLGIEGYDDSQWIILDYGNVVIHLFDASAREYYCLDELWGDSPRVEIPDNGQATQR
ncbi:MAG: ribosome silencing factor [Planctomycetota bacterium]